MGLKGVWMGDVWERDVLVTGVWVKGVGMSRFR